MKIYLNKRGHYNLTKPSGKITTLHPDLYRLDIQMEDFGFFLDCNEGIEIDNASDKHYPLLVDKEKRVYGAIIL